ncbi:MAG: phosphatase PAP2 family protein [Nitrospinae bacterium]|nr:phosphatase PAP2 family protein [Nitrospinota bacterium]
MPDYVVWLDEKLFLWINNGWSTPALDYFFTAATIAGNAAGWFCLGLLWTLLFGAKNLKRGAAVFTIAMVVAGLLMHGTKELAGRDRPLEHFKKKIEAGEVTVKVPYERLTANSFPSGHAQAAFTAATFLALYYRRYGALLLGMAIIVGISRIYVAAHFPADVAAGALIGAFFGWLAWKLDPKAPVSNVLKEPASETNV